MINKMNPVAFVAFERRLVPNVAEHIQVADALVAGGRSRNLGDAHDPVAEGLRRIAAPMHPSVSEQDGADVAVGDRDAQVNLHNLLHAGCAQNGTVHLGHIVGCHHRSAFLRFDFTA